MGQVCCKDLAACPHRLFHGRVAPTNAECPKDLNICEASRMETEADTHKRGTPFLPAAVHECACCCSGRAVPSYEFPARGQTTARWIVAQVLARGNMDIDFNHTVIGHLHEQYLVVCGQLTPECGLLCAKDWTWHMHSIAKSVSFTLLC